MSDPHSGIPESAEIDEGEPDVGEVHRFTVEELEAFADFPTPDGVHVWSTADDSGIPE